MKKSIKITLSILLIALFSGCTTNITTPSIVAPKVDSTLEGIDRGTIMHISDINSIAFEWKRPKSPRVEGYVIYRSSLNSKDAKLKEIKKIDSAYTSHFADTGLSPKSKYVYRFATYDKNGVESLATKDLVISTLDRPEAISYIESINNLPKTAKIIWRPHPSERIKGYKVYKNDTTDATFRKIATVNGRLNAEYIDDGLEDSKVYKYKVVAFTYDDIDSYHSKEVVCSTKPLPKMIDIVSATEDKPKEILLKWKPTDIKDMVEYRVYRASSLDGSYSLKAKTKKTEYKDIVKENGRAFFYKVTVVDKDGLESLKQDIAKMGKSLSAPKTPTITSVTIKDNKVVLNWTTLDNRAVSYVVVKRIKEGWNKSKKINIKDITGTNFVDIQKVVAGREYTYSVRSVDKNGIISPESKPTVVQIPKKDK
jgi:fibronectin type 3 domain-containing protein